MNEDQGRADHRAYIGARLAEIGKLGDPVPRAALHVGDIVQTAPRVERIIYGGMSGPILSVSGRNVRVSVEYKPSPTGPTYMQEHVVPLAHLDWVRRGDMLCEVVDA